MRIKTFSCAAQRTHLRRDPGCMSPQGAQRPRRSRRRTNSPGYQPGPLQLVELDTQGVLYGQPYVN